MTHRILIIALCLSAFAGIAADKIQPGRLDIDPPTLIGGGYQWWMDGDANHNATLTTSFRIEGTQDWLPAPEAEYPRTQSYSKFQRMHDSGGIGGGRNGFGEYYPIGAHFAGSIIDLQEDTAYEIRLVLSDPDGIAGHEGDLERIAAFRTRAVPQAAGDGRSVEVFPDGSGLSLQDAIADLRPGDTLLLHGGTYTPPAFDEPPTRVSNGDPVVIPEPGRVLHVYPPGYKGEKQEPYFRNITEAYNGSDWDADFNFIAPIDPVIRDENGQAFGAQPGDTILVHPGKYISKINSYHHNMVMWQTGAYYMSRRGTSEAPIVIKAAEGGEVIVDGDAAYRLFDLRNAKHHIIDGLTIRNAYVAFDAGDGRNGMNGSDIVIQNCTIQQVQRAAIGEHVRVIDCQIEEDAFPDRFEGTWSINTDGTAQQPITLKPFGDGAVVLDGQGTYLLFDTMNADHLIFEDLILRNNFMSIEAGGRFGQLGATGLTVKRCRFHDIILGIFGIEGMCRDFTILDNIFSSKKNTGAAPLSGGYAVVLAGAGHAVGYNETSGFWDHLNVLTGSTAIPGQRSWSMDFYNNYSRGCQDNFYEVDGTMWNVRYMRNLCGFAGAVQFSSQPVAVGPAYFLRNILYHADMAKQVNANGVKYWHNTIVGDMGHYNRPYADMIVNNVFLQEGTENGPVDRRKRPIKVVQFGEPMSHNAWRLGGPVGAEHFAGKRGMKSVASFQELIDTHAPHDVEVDFDDFVDIPKPDWQTNPRTAPYPADLRDMDFFPADGSPVIDAGKVLRGINDRFIGDGPDMGALEKGQDAPHYGPRTLPPPLP